MDQLEGRNVVLEALKRGRRRVLRVQLDERAKPDPKLKAILDLASSAGVRVERVDRGVLNKASETGVHNGIIAWAEPRPRQSLRQFLEANYDPDLLLLLVDEVQYEHNLGAILRSAAAAGAHAVVIPVRRGKGLTPVVHRVAMGGAEEVPVIREGISSALAAIRRAGIRVVGADMSGRPHWEADLTGPLALVLGGESKGLTSAVRKRCDEVVGVPLQRDIESLNVSVTAAVLLFERTRQMTETGGG